MKKDGLIDPASCPSILRWDWSDYFIQLKWMVINKTGRSECRRVTNPQKWAVLKKTECFFEQCPFRIVHFRKRRNERQNGMNVTWNERQNCLKGPFTIVHDRPLRCLWPTFLARERLLLDNCQFTRYLQIFPGSPLSRPQRIHLIFRI